MTQRALADAIGACQSMVSDWERGKRVPRADQVEPLAEALGVDTPDILRAVGKQP